MKAPHHSLVPLVLLLGVASCNVLPEVNAMARYQRLEPDGDFAADSGGAAVASSFEELGLGDEESSISPRADLSFGPVDVMVSAFQLNADGQGQATGTIDLGGTTITAGENVDSELDLTQAVALVTWDVVPTDLIDVGLGLGLTYLDFSVVLDGAVSGRAETAEEVPVPVLAARAEVDLGMLTGNLHVHGIAIDYDGVDAMYLDADAFLAYRFEELLGFDARLALGYRHVQLEFEYEDDGSDVDGDLTLSGLYFGLALGL